MNANSEYFIVIVFEFACKKLFVIALFSLKNNGVDNTYLDGKKRKKNKRERENSR